jgi:hypothetical protein
MSIIWNIFPKNNSNKLMVYIGVRYTEYFSERLGGNVWTQTKTLGKQIVRIDCLFSLLALLSGLQK